MNLSETHLQLLVNPAGPSGVLTNTTVCLWAVVCSPTPINDK